MTRRHIIYHIDEAGLSHKAPHVPNIKGTFRVLGKTDAPKEADTQAQENAIQKINPVQDQQEKVIPKKKKEQKIKVGDRAIDQ